MQYLYFIIYDCYEADTTCKLQTSSVTLTVNQHVCNRHIALLWWTVVPSYLKIKRYEPDISTKTICVPHTLNRYGWTLRPARRRIMGNMYMYIKLIQSRPRVMKWTWWHLTCKCYLEPLLGKQYFKSATMFQAIWRASLLGYTFHYSCSNKFL